MIIKKTLSREQETPPEDKFCCHFKKSPEEVLQFLKNLLESNQDSIAIFNHQGNLNFVNSAFVKLFQYQDCKQIAQAHLSQFFQPEETELLIALLRDGSKEPLKIQESYARTQNGSLIPVSIYSFAIQDQKGERLGLFCSIRDITEKKQAEKALRESEEKYRILAETITDEVWVMGLDLKFSYVSPSVKKLRGFSPEEAIKQPIQEKMPPESLQKMVQVLQSALAEEKLPERELDKVWCVELELYRKDGTTFWAETTTKFLRDENNNPIAIIGITRDITERKKAEQERQKLLLSLAQTEKLASLGQLAGGMAHEINNPLAYIRANLKVLDDYREDLLALFKAQKEFFENIIAQSSRWREPYQEQILSLEEKINIAHLFSDFAELIQESLDGVARIQYIIQSLKKFAEPSLHHPEWADLNVILENVLKLLKPKIERKAQLHLRLSPLPKIKCYPQELGQVFFNLISNALNAISDQGELLVQSWKEDGVLKVKIQDNGTGIKADQLTRIFEPFYSNSGLSESKGLGLSIAYGIIKRHQGEIKVESELGKGSSFTVELPWREEKLDGG